MHANGATTSRAAREAVRNPWLGVELRHLAALAAVARERSFRGAADSLGYVQSAVSQQVAHLERVVGQRLVERQRGATAVVLTVPGELLLEHAENILAGLGAAQADLEALAEGQGGRLRVGACSSLAAEIFRRLLPRVLRRVPKLRIEASEALAHQLAVQVADGLLDAAFAELPLPEGPFRSIELCTDSYQLLAHPDVLPFSAGAEPTVHDLGSLPLLGHPLMGSVEPVLQKAGIERRYELWCDSLVSLRKLVAAGIGCAIVPGLLGATADEDLAVLPLDTAIPPRQICVFQHSGRRSSPAVDLLVELAVWVCGPLGPDARPELVVTPLAPAG